MEHFTLHLYVDGSFDPVLKHGGWGVVVIENGSEIAALAGGIETVDNGAMELEAILAAIHWLEVNAPSRHAAIWSDAIYAVNGCNSWRLIWRNNGWKKRSPNGKGRGRTVPNAERWKEIDQHLRRNPMISVFWCKGHSGLTWNEQADKLAEQGRLNAAETDL